MQKILASPSKILGMEFLNPTSQFTGTDFTDLLHAHHVQISMDGKGRAIDNIFTERLWRTIKYEEVYLKDYSSPRDARQALDAYIQFYNYERIHQSLDYQTPASVFLLVKQLLFIRRKFS